MKNKDNSFALWMLSILILLLRGCISPGIFSTKVITASPIVHSLQTPSHIILPTQDVGPFLTVTPSVPIQSSEQTIRMNDALHSSTCDLPCYLGIVPGKTTLSEGRAILEDFGMEFFGSFLSADGIILYHTYKIRIGNIDQLTEIPEQNGESSTILQYIMLTTVDGVIQSMDVIIAATGLVDTYRAYWLPFFPKGILQKYGPPEEIYLGRLYPDLAMLGHRLLLIYKKLGVTIEIYGNQEDNNICTPEGTEARSFSLRMTLYNPNGKIDIYADGRVPPTDEAVWTSIEEALKIDPVEFHRQLTSELLPCFQPYTKTSK